MKGAGYILVWARVLEPLRGHLVALWCANRTPQQVLMLRGAFVALWGRLFDNIEEPARIQKWIVGEVHRQD